MIRSLGRLGVALLAVAAIAFAQGAKTTSIDFERDAPGKPPADFVAAMTGPGAAGEWVVKEEKGAPSGAKVLCQASNDPTSNRYALCIYDKVSARNVSVSVKFKLVSGKTDQAAGIVLLYKDKDSYYLASASAAEGNVRLYKVEGGKRGKEFTDDKVQIKLGEWHTLTFGVRKDFLTVSLDGRQLRRFEDDNLERPTPPGKVGLWTRADSVTCFDDLTIEVQDKN